MNDLMELMERANPARLEDIDVAGDAATAELLGNARTGKTGPGWRRPHVRWSARLLIAVAIVLGVGVPLASAVGFGDWLMHIVNGSSIPGAVREDFRLLDRKAVAPPQGARARGLTVDSKTERLVVRIHTQTGGIASLYAARVVGGGYCTVAVGLPFDGGGCTQAPARPGKYPLYVASSGQFGGAKGTRIADGLTSEGCAASTRASTIRVTYRDGETSSIPLSNGWYLYEVPAPHDYRGHEPIRFDVLGVKGQILGTIEDPLGLETTRVAPRRPVPATIETVARAPLRWRGANVVLSSARDPQGDRCWRYTNTKDHIQTNHWWCGPEVGNPIHLFGPTRPTTPVYVQRGIRVSNGEPGYVYYTGWVSAKIASLELRYQDSTVYRFALHERLFLYVLPGTRFALGHRPSYLIGRDPSGRVVYRKFLYPKAPCSYPGPQARCAPGEHAGSG